MYQHGLVFLGLLCISATFADSAKDATATTGTGATTLPTTTEPQSKLLSTIQPPPTDPSKLYGPPDSDFLQALEIHIRRGSVGNQTYYYDSTVRPNLFSDLDISVEFYLTGITKVDEKAGSITLTGVLIMGWVDDRLVWDPASFGNITTLTYEGYKLWSPRFFHNGNYFIRQYNSVLRADVSYDGKVWMVMSMHEEIPCLFDMTKFPRDTQTCYVQLYHSDPKVKLHANRSAYLAFDKSKAHDAQPRHVAWEILNVTMVSQEQIAGTDSGELLLITIKMKRHANFFIRVYVAPVCFLLLLIPVIFLLPPDSSEKLTFGAVLLFCMIFVTQSMESMYPPYTDTTPHLIRLTNASGSLLFLCILLTGLISSAERVGRKRAIPPLVKKYVIGVIGPYLLVKENEASHGTVHLRSVADSDKDFIVQNEQGMGTEERNGGICAAELTGAVDNNNQALHALVNELKQSRLQGKTRDDWTSVFTILNRFLFLLTLLIGIIITLCFA